MCNTQNSGIYCLIQPYVISLPVQDNKKQSYLDALPGVLKQFSNFLGERKWFAGDKVTLLTETC